MHVGTISNHVTMYAQTRVMGKDIPPPQVGPGEWHK
jgi:hypothetical protein